MYNYLYAIFIAVHVYTFPASPPHLSVLSSLSLILSLQNY